MAMNDVSLVGRAAAVPELRYNTAGNPYARIRLAVNRLGPQGEEIADFFDVFVNGKQAENCAKYVVKGHLLGISGELRTRAWDQDGTRREAVFISARSVQFLARPLGQNGSAPTEQPGHEEDIPFLDNKNAPATQHPVTA